MTTQAKHDPKLGLLLLGRYRIVRKLGEGGMGAVYEGQHELIGKRLAIKCLHPQFSTNPEIVERFYREAQAATAVGNEHIIEVTDVGTFDDGSPFIVMEFLEGIELTKLIEQESGLSVSRLVHIVTQVCGALSAAHARGIVHRDMKPENIFLIRRGNDADFVKVLDFGVSKVRDASESLGSGLTRTGMAIGTPYYMPPEQAQGVRDIDHRADVYAVGVILYQGLSGHLPFDAESYPALMLKIMSERPAPLRVFRNDLPDALEQVVLKAMARDRNDRFQTVEDLAEALQRFAVLQTMPPGSMSRRTGISAIPQTTPFVTAAEQPAAPELKPRSAGARKWLVLGIAALIATAGAAAWLARPSTTTPDAQAPAMQPSAAAVPIVPEEPTVAQAPAPTRKVEAPPPDDAPSPREVQVKISATPSEARIYIGDQEFPNPMDAFRPRSLDPVRIRVEARGHETVEQLAIFDQNRQLSFALAPGRGVRKLDAVDAPAVASPAKGVHAPAATKGAVETAPAPTPTPVEPPTPKEDGVYHGPTGKLRDEL